MGSLIYVFELSRFALRAMAAWAALHFFAMSAGFLRRKAPQMPALPAIWPRVTVQLPVRNEYYTACRVLDAVAAFDYPADRLQIQVLDDSDDGTSELLAARVAVLKELGHDVMHIRREVPTHFKAGALRMGLEYATGELVAMFDADFVPEPDFLRRTVPWFSDAQVAMVQGAWAHLNREDSWLTRLQAQIIDALFLIEQTAKSRAGLPFQFNGTAGVWRRAAVDRAGGWTFDSLTEDLDLSIRVQLLGHRMLHLPDVRVPSELPTTLAAFRVQQRRWALGTAQLLRKRLLTVLRSDLPLSARFAIVTQLGRHLIHPLVLVMVISVPITTLYPFRTLVNYGWVNAAVLGAVVLGIATQHAIAARVAGQSPLRAVLRAPAVVVLAIGLVPTYCAALYYGLLDRAGIFYRTPKVTRAHKPGEPDYRPRRSWLVLAEIAVGVAYAAFTYTALSRGLWQSGAFLAMVGAAFLLLGFGSIPTSAPQPLPAPGPSPAPAPEMLPAVESADPVSSLSVAQAANRAP